MPECIANADVFEIEVTPEMIEAGEEEFLSFDSRFERESDCVARVYKVMERTRLRSVKGDTGAGNLS